MAGPCWMELPVTYGHCPQIQLQWLCRELPGPPQKNPPLKFTSPLQHTVVNSLLDHHPLHQLVKLWQFAGYHAIFPRRQLGHVAFFGKSVQLTQCSAQHALCSASDAF